MIAYLIILISHIKHISHSHINGTSRKCFFKFYWSHLGLHVGPNNACYVTRHILFFPCHHVTFYKTLTSLSTVFIKGHVRFLQLLKWPCRTSFFYPCGALHFTRIRLTPTETTGTPTVTPYLATSVTRFLIFKFIIATSNLRGSSQEKST